jgi:hypothetical protein
VRIPTTLASTLAYESGFHLEQVIVLHCVPAMLSVDSHKHALCCSKLMDRGKGLPNVGTYS